MGLPESTSANVGDGSALPTSPPTPPRRSLHRPIALAGLLGVMCL